MTSVMEWRTCPRFPNYEVSECGDLRARPEGNHPQRGRRLKGIINSDGYIDYSITDATGRRLHVLSHVMVAEAFIGPKLGPDYEVAHDNGSRIGNHFSNLRWALRKSNSDDRYIHGTDVRGERNGHAKISEDDVRYIRRRYREIKRNRGDIRELERKFGLHRATICKIAQGSSWSHVPMEEVA